MHINRRFVGILLSIAPALSFAAPSKRTLPEYMDHAIAARDVVADDRSNRTYVVLDFKRTLTPADDPSHIMAPGTIDPRQGQFNSITIDQILVELNKDGLVPPGAPIDIYAKVDWSGEAKTGLTLHASHLNIVHGRLTLGANRSFKFEVLDLPGMMFLGQFYANLDVATIFGHQVTENEVLEIDLRAFAKAVVGAVLPTALDLKPVSINPP